MLCSYLYSHPYTATTHCTDVQYIYNTVAINTASFIQPPIPLQPTVQVYSIYILLQSIQHHLYSHPYHYNPLYRCTVYIYCCNQYSIIYTATHTTTINTALHVVYQNITVLAKTSANDDTSIYVSHCNCNYVCVPVQQTIVSSLLATF